MTRAGRLRDELLFHDAQARQRSATFKTAPERLLVDDEWYLGHESWIRPSFRRLGPLDGRAVLDLGCGHGMASVVLARRGARVTALDLSLEYLREARARAEANRVGVNFVQADGERLPFADGSFDAVWGNAILHHFDVSCGGAEIRRVLRPSGVAVLCEPWGENPLLRLARVNLPYPGKGRTAEEEPLRRGHLAALRRVFPSVTVEGFQLLSMVRRLTGPGRLAAALEAADAALLGAFPGLYVACRYVVLTLRQQKTVHPLVS